MLRWLTADFKIKTLKQQYSDEAKKMHWELFLVPRGQRWHLYSSFTNGIEDNKGRSGFVSLFSIIAAFILLIACINFMNLSTARSEKRAKEVGIRKVVGAQKASLVVAVYRRVGFPGFPGGDYCCDSSTAEFTGL
jgi:putative ABC transport system permease protein